jgi:hypothetical protein
MTVGMIGIVTAIASGFGFRFSPEIRDIAQLASQNSGALSRTKKGSGHRPVSPGSLCGACVCADSGDRIQCLVRQD